MRDLFKICRSIFKKNKGFSICLFLISLLSFVTSILAANFASSAHKTISNFFSYTGVPDALITTNLIDSSVLDEIKQFDGVDKVYDRLVFDVSIETDQGKQFSSRLLTYGEDEPYKLEYQRKIETSEEEIRTYISYEFADYNNLDLGDKFSILTPYGKHEVVVAATVSSVETFKCIKDEMSNYEAYEFGYIYIPKSDFAKIVDLSSKLNCISIYFEGGLKKSEQNKVLNEIEQTLGTDLIASSIVSEMQSIKSINEDIKTIEVLCVFIPGVIFLISLGFSFEFLKIIINNQSKTISLLKSLGYNSSRITCIFILFTLIINAFALIIGLPLGFLLLRLCVGLVSKANGILTISYDISILLSIVLIILVFVIGVLASLFTSKSISKIDPILISNNLEYENAKAPKLIQKVKCKPFMKISLISTFKRHKRFIIGFLCLATCIITMSVGFEGSATLAYPNEAVYGERFKYDLMVRDIDGDVFSKIKTNVNNIELIEPVSYFKSNVAEEEVVVSTIKENSELIVLKNANGDVIYPGSGIIVDEMFAQINNISIGDMVSLNNTSLKVTEIAREIALPMFYISQETAENVFLKSINCALIKAKDISNIETIKKEIIEINPNSYFSLRSSQKENMNNRSMAMRTIMLVLSFLSFLIGSLFVFNITIIDFNEKKSDYITLKAIGASPRKLCKISLFENLARLLVGIVVAVPLSYVANRVLLKLLSVQSSQYVMVRFWPCLLIAIAISLLYILISWLISLRVIKKMDLIEKLSEME